MRLSGFARDIEAFAQEGKPFGFFPFGAPVTIAFSYDQAGVAGIDESTLGIVLFDSFKGVYSTEGISIINKDPDANTITFAADRLGLFAIAGKTETTTTPGFPPVLLLTAAGLSIVLLLLLLRKIRRRKD